jgi:hypothetical protein
MKKRTRKEINLKFLISMILLVFLSLNSGATFGQKWILGVTWGYLGILNDTWGCVFSKKMAANKQ